MLIRIGRDEVEVLNAPPAERHRLLQELGRELRFRVKRRWCG